MSHLMHHRVTGMNKGKTHQQAKNIDLGKSTVSFLLANAELAGVTYFRYR